MLCEKCGGAGRISCGCCWGGQRQHVCPDCLGKGVMPDTGKPCVRCHGRGKVTPNSCPHCGNSTLCPQCGGSGEI